MLLLSMKEKDNIALSFHWWLALMIRTFASITKKRRTKRSICILHQNGHVWKGVISFLQIFFFEYFPFSISSMYGRIPNKKPNVMRLWSYY
jgi:hypothetical protein